MEFAFYQQGKYTKKGFQSTYRTIVTADPLQQFNSLELALGSTPDLAREESTTYTPPQLEQSGFADRNTFCSLQTGAYF